MDAALRTYLALTRRLPPVKGAGAVANALKRAYARKRRATGLVEVDVLGSRMALDPNEVVDRDLLFAPQLYDRPQMRYLREHLREGDTFLDVGANVGVYALFASRLVGASGRVVAVEADPFNVAKLQRNVGLNAHARNVTVLGVGVADAAGELNFFAGVHGNRGGGSFALEHADGSVRVPVLPLLAILEQQGVKRAPRAMKIDVELYEHRVLQRFFADAPHELWPLHILTERHDDPKYQALAGGDAIALCESKGYHVAWSHGGEFVLAL